MSQVKFDADGLKGIDPEEADLTFDKESLDYVSKSRIKTYLQCPFKFALKYWAEHRPPGTIHTERGSQVHEAFELFGENVKEYVAEHDEAPTSYAAMMPDNHELWSQWLEPFVGNFWEFEDRRWDTAHDRISYADSRLPSGTLDIHEETLNAWEPIAVEAEAWLGEPPEDHERANPDFVNEDGPPVGDIPWMGKADAIFHTASIPDVNGSGVVILDYKTGKAPTVKYEGAPFLDEVLNEGIFLEGEYYGWLFEKFYDIDAVAGYYPRDDELIVSPYPSQERRWDIKRAAMGMQKTPEIPEDAQQELDDGPKVPTNFPFETSPLCHWGDGKCHFYDVCPSRQGD